MKFALRSRQNDAYLQKADEILVDFRDRKQIPELAEKYPGKTVILIQHYGEELDIKELVNYKILTQDNFIVCLTNLKYVEELKTQNIPWYWGYPISTYYQLWALKEMGACYAKLDAPIFFDMPGVKKVDIPIRVVPNVAYSDGLERVDGVCGTWIRPEDVEAYDEYVDVMEFEDCDQRKEQAMYRIYAEDHNWPTDLGLLITNFNHTGVNRLIHTDFSRQRLNCRQLCQEGNGCMLCYRMMHVADPDLIRSYINGE